ncbi:MAG TPA: phospholipase A, partial [Elusimicrobiales bacterium]|nr:phospholipase A [Elusimicrobiales bacterium]
MTGIISAMILLFFIIRPAVAQQNDVSTSEDAATAIDYRMAQENHAKESRFAMLSHKPNYLLPASYTSSPNSPAYASLPDIRDNLSNVEFKFQLSFKFPLWTDILDGKASVYAAYS